jgi:hypothetical protein
MCDADSDFEFVNDIAADVLLVLEKDGVFERLDNLFCPLDSSKESVLCGHSFEHSIGILRSIGMDSDEIDDVLAVLKSRGGCCDCEVLYNVVDESRFKAQYWKARSAELTVERRQAQFAENGYLPPNP